MIREVVHWPWCRLHTRGSRLPPEPAWPWVPPDPSARGCSFPGAKSASDGGTLAVQSRGPRSPLKTAADLGRLRGSGALWRLAQKQATAWGWMNKVTNTWIDQHKKKKDSWQAWWRRNTNMFTKQETYDLFSHCICVFFCTLKVISRNEASSSPNHTSLVPLDSRGDHRGIRPVSKDTDRGRSGCPFAIVTG